MINWCQRANTGEGRLRGGETLSFHSADGNLNVYVNNIPVQKRAGRQLQAGLPSLWSPLLCERDLGARLHTGRTVLPYPSEMKLAKQAAPQHVTVYVEAGR